MIQGDTPGLPHLFLTSSQYLRCSITVFHSYYFSWSNARLTMVHTLYRKTSSLVGATVLFCTFAVLFPFIPWPQSKKKTQALILSSFSLDTRLRKPDRAASWPPELMPVRLWGDLFHSVHFHFISVIHGHPQLFTLFMRRVSDKSNQMMMMMSYSGCCEVLQLLRELAVISRPFITGVVF